MLSIVQIVGKEAVAMVEDIHQGAPVYEPLTLDHGSLFTLPQDVEV